MLDERIIELVFGSGKRGTRDEGRPSFASRSGLREGGETSLIALTARHRQAVTEAIENIGESISELRPAITKLPRCCCGPLTRAFPALSSST